VQKPCHIFTAAARESATVIEQFCQANHQILLPILNLIQIASQAVETAIHEIGDQMLEQILLLSGEQVAGVRAPDRPSGEIRHHGSQARCVQVADRKVKLKRPRLGHKTAGEVKVPACELLRRHRGVGTSGDHWCAAFPLANPASFFPAFRNCWCFAERDQTKVVDASIEDLKRLQERRWEDVAILMSYIDGQRFGAHHMLSAVSVDAFRMWLRQAFWKRFSPLQDSCLTSLIT
jgi:hypothetical protein